MRGSGRFFFFIADIVLRTIVSIPFIAGQWSLPQPRWYCWCCVSFVSIPFIARQWSLRSFVRAAALYGILFQSPSLRGSGRFFFLLRHWIYPASWKFQSPSLRGSGRFSVLLKALRLPGGGFNPLHCGAVVASYYLEWSGSIRPCFNPLHCGAVVASYFCSCCRSSHHHVSIPFIAGQWSLRVLMGRQPERALVFQSPSLRGSGRFHYLFRCQRFLPACFNPLHCGAVVASSSC